MKKDPRNATTIALEDGFSTRTAFRRRSGEQPYGTRRGRPRGPALDVYRPLLRKHLSGLPLVDEDAKKIAKELSVSVRKVRENLAALRAECAKGLEEMPPTS